MSRYLIYCKLTDNCKTYNIDSIFVQTGKNMKEAINNLIENNKIFLSDKNWYIYSISKLDGDIDLKDLQKEVEDE